MKLSSPLLTLALSLLAACTARADLPVIFRQDFSDPAAYVGTGPNQFNYVGSAEEGRYAVTFIEGGRYQMVTNFSPDSVVNLSATRLSRHGTSPSAPALPFKDNFAVLTLDFRFNPPSWTMDNTGLFTFSLGQNFRGGAHNPVRKSVKTEGPDFVQLFLQGRAKEGVFRFISGGGPGSSDFIVTKSADEFYEFKTFIAFNNSGQAQEFDSPTGRHVLATASLSIWVNGALVWNNHSGGNIRPAAQFQHISLSVGNGAEADFSTAQIHSGTYQLDNIVVSTLP